MFSKLGHERVAWHRNIRQERTATATATTATAPEAFAVDPRVTTAYRDYWLPVTAFSSSPSTRLYTHINTPQSGLADRAQETALRSSSLATIGIARTDFACFGPSDVDSVSNRQESTTLLALLRVARHAQPLMPSYRSLS
ncbi:DNA repair protein [Pseudozyma hubeiensis SY62]|uniref:DNA repair protein n=1 Tax=Pseudozyma hubeiensis (strain SY62) TaxID=1305764 RepID=R9NXR8_PSEHS|nr:DNA repair protein [Pseudozyma hubeiensis SY62]GAC93391.1 DNA repair protein [Pseudozyma hubeiensis SY62]